MKHITITNEDFIRALNKGLEDRVEKITEAQFKNHMYQTVQRRHDQANSVYDTLGEIQKYIDSKDYTVTFHTDGDDIYYRIESTYKPRYPPLIRVIERSLRRRNE